MHKPIVVMVVMLLLSASAALAKPRRVYTVDEVTAKLSGNRITVEAKGTVRTGGYQDAKLVQTSNRGGTLTFEFVATPPTGMVMQMITPISAKVTTGALRRPFPTKVKVLAETNSKTVKVAK